MLFILFDIEVVFLYPVAVQLRAFGSFALVETDRLHRAAARGLRLRVEEGSARMEIVRREKTGADEFKVRQRRAQQMLRGELDGDDLEQHVRESIVTTTLDKAVGWARGNALFPMTFGLACCAIEMMSIVASRVDVARFGFEAFRASPRQADLLIISGRVSIKMAPVVRRIYDQMLEPKYSIAMGACSSSMGVFNNYAIVPGRQVHARRRPRARLPAAARGAHARHPAGCAR